MPRPRRMVSMIHDARGTRWARIALYRRSLACGRRESLEFRPAGPPTGPSPRQVVVSRLSGTAVAAGTEPAKWPSKHSERGSFRVRRSPRLPECRGRPSPSGPARTTVRRPGACLAARRSPPDPPRASPDVHDSRRMTRPSGMTPIGRHARPVPTVPAGPNPAPAGRCPGAPSITGRYRTPLRHPVSPSRDIHGHVHGQHQDGGARACHHPDPAQDPDVRRHVSPAQPQAESHEEHHHRPEGLLEGMPEMIQADHGEPAAQLGDEDERQDRPPNHVQPGVPGQRRQLREQQRALCREAQLRHRRDAPAHEDR